MKHGIVFNTQMVLPADGVVEFSCLFCLELETLQYSNKLVRPGSNVEIHMSRTQCKLNVVCCVGRVEIQIEI